MPPAFLPRTRSLKRALGDVADPAWWQAAETVVLRETVSGNAARQETRVQTAWDDAHWHVRFEVLDTHVWATHRARSLPLWEEEVVEVFFDPVGDLEAYFEVEINPLGTVKDLVLRRTASGWRKNFDWSVDDLRSGVERTAQGWNAHLSIPFAALGAEAPVAGGTWRVNFLRIDRPDGPGGSAELDAWSPTGLRQFHRAERFGFMEFTTGGHPHGG